MSKKREIKKFFHAREIGILAEYLNQWSSVPAGTDWLGYDEPAPGDWDEATQGIGIREGAPYASQDPEQNALPNAVARICLTNVQDNLPQWASIKDDEVTLARKVKRTTELPSRILLPQHLFTINWANSAPGLSWPEAYYVTYLPGWDVHIVTASQDSDEIYGYEDFAIGWFKGKEDPVEGSKDILISYWGNLSREFCQERWEELFDISAGDPEGWADKIWAREDEDKPKKTLADVFRDAGSALTVQFDDETTLTEGSTEEQA